MNVFEGYKYFNVVYVVERIKEEVLVLVFVVNGIYLVEIVEEILRERDVDMVDIGRGFFINFNWVNDVKEGKDIGKCLSCVKCMWFG